MRPEDILIVNDGSPFLKTIGLILADKGHRTCVTNDPLEARTELARKYFRLVIVKLQGKTADAPALLNAVQDLNPKARLIILGEDARLPRGGLPARGGRLHPPALPAGGGLAPHHELPESPSRAPPPRRPSRGS